MRAARLSPDPAVRARRLLTAAEAAVSTGQTEWARDLAARALTLTGEEDLRSWCLHVTGWALAWGGHFAGALQTMLALARERTVADSKAAWDALGLAATAAYQAGDPDSLPTIVDWTNAGRGPRIWSLGFVLWAAGARDVDAARAHEELPSVRGPDQIDGRDVGHAAAKIDKRFAQQRGFFHA